MFVNPIVIVLELIPIQDLIHVGINFIPEEFLVRNFKFKNKIWQYPTYIIPIWHFKQNYNFSDIPPENWKCNFQIKFYTGDDIQPKM